MTRTACCIALLGLLVSGPAGGATWQTEREALPSLGTGISLGASFPADADALGRIHVAFQSGTPTEGYEIGYTRREADGTWGHPTTLSVPGLDSRNPSLCVDEAGAVHVVWQDLSTEGGDILYRRRDAQENWGPLMDIAPAMGDSERPVVRADAFDRVHVAWVDTRAGRREILHALRAGSEAWAAPTVLSAGGVQPQEPYLAEDGLGVLHAVWADRGTTFETRQSYDIVYARIEPHAVAGGPPSRIVDHLASALKPHLAAREDGVLYLVWADDRATWADRKSEIFYKRFLPGIGWGRDKRFTYEEGGTGRPVVAIGSSTSVDIAWEDSRGGNPEVYYRQITEAAGWDRLATQLTTDISPSQAPTLIALPGNRLVMLWTDASGGTSFRVYARQGSSVSEP